jgi:hypothetical protein
MKRVIPGFITFLAPALMVALLSACSSGGGSGNDIGDAGAAPDTGAISGLTIRLTDAKVNSLEAVWVTFTQVTFQPADGRERFTHVFDEPISVELTQLAGGGEVMLLDEYPLEPGDYAWLRLGVLSGEAHVDDTYVVEDLSQGGLFFPLKCPSCAKEQSGLKLLWPEDSTWETEGWADFTIDFDVRRSITLAKPNAGPNKKYILKPVLQILSTELASTYIHGVVIDAGLTDPTLREDCVVYVFEGDSPSITPDDYCSLDFEGADCDESRGDTALTTANVDLDIDTGDYAYRTMFLYPGTYTVALTCDQDAPDTEENPTFIGETTLLAEAVPDGAEHDFRLADIELELTKALATDDSPYEEGETIDYSYIVANNSADGADGVVGPVVVTDDQVDVDCEAVNTVGNMDDNLDPGESVQCTASYTVTGDDARAGSVSNTATASMGSTNSNEAVLSVATTTTPVLVVSKAGELDGDFAAGETISYSFTAENAGNVELTNVEISDDLPGLSELSCTPEQPVDVLAIGAALSCNASYTITAADETAGSVSNTATGTSAESGDVPSNPVELGL